MLPAMTWQAPTAVVFDNDGLLLDTESVWTRAEQDLFERRGKEFTPADKRELVGTSAEIAGGVLERRLAEPGRAAELIEELNELVIAELEHGVEAMVGARELLHALPLAGTDRQSPELAAPFSYTRSSRSPPSRTARRQRKPKNKPKTADFVSGERAPTCLESDTRACSRCLWRTRRQRLQAAAVAAAAAGRDQHPLRLRLPLEEAHLIAASLEDEIVALNLVL